MTRALRVLTLVGALFLGFYLLALALSHAHSLPPLATGPGGELSTFLLAVLAMLISALIGSAIMSTAGVIAIVTTVQRRQLGWTITLIGVLALFCASVFLMFSFPGLTRFLAQPLLSSTWFWFGEVPLLAVALATLTGVLVLIYSFVPVQSASSPPGQTTKG